MFSSSDCTTVTRDVCGDGCVGNTSVVSVSLSVNSGAFVAQYFRLSYGSLLYTRYYKLSHRSPRSSESNEIFDRALLHAK